MCCFSYQMTAVYLLVIFLDNFLTGEKRVQRNKKLKCLAMSCLSLDLCDDSKKQHWSLAFTLFKANRIFHKDTCNKVRMVYFIYWGVTSHSLKKNIIFLPLKMEFILANRADLDKMPHYAAFHLGFHCLPRYPFRGYRIVKRKHLRKIRKKAVS